ncbi:MAG: hypothetical protein IM585_11365 [Pseudanabaena sp. M135S2SP2A07QC]|nr:hypothetical protein [Pseudanabaena sp. M125S2SP2A07QC]MCA6544958.1 hypothetical protein [Pseudanabaena sp. M074S1SP2A07QC]MCA6546221.1 hypothetical protein [Pseudanabaena sp. M152S2SP2A07QC]MCA6552578.1 hypothetical protein [Pseudanabaena sp. M135S2SP2A07QC]MCA6570690.1 hypothetical protein [Pseudanabaena sp. M065S1SP2A07QC]
MNVQSNHHIRDSLEQILTADIFPLFPKPKNKRNHSSQKDLSHQQVVRVGKVVAGHSPKYLEEFLTLARLHADL